MQTWTSSTRKVSIPGILALVLLLSACAPQLGPAPAQTDQAASELQRTAQLAFHRMEIGFLQTGAYTTNALVDLDLPRGMRWTLEEFTDGFYRLRFTDDDNPDEAWVVSPRGVSPAPLSEG